MSTYYQYQDVGVMIAHRLFKTEGWTVYGYHADESDSMTDYFSPAYWGGIAEKNGYILCFNVHREAKQEEIKKYNNESNYDRSIMEKIQKLEAMTVERGASEGEEETAKTMIAKLREKAEEDNNKYIVTGVIPAHLANPPKCNWHIEKDGVIIAKGNGVLKYAHVDKYYRYDSYMKELKKFQTMTEEDYKKDYISNYMYRWNDSEEKAASYANEHYKEMKKDAALVENFEDFINKIDTACGGLLGDGDGVIYEKVTVTEYKKENKAIETVNGSLKDGQCFILKSSFNYGRCKGLVYRIHEVGEGDEKYFTAYKLNKKLTKECHGSASQNNSWYIGTTDNISKWIEKGAVSWCDIQEVKTPYEVEKVVKKTLKSEKKAEQKNTTEATGVDISNLTFEVSEDTDTRTDEKIYLVKVTEKLSREDYVKVNKYIKSIGGYYSKFKHAFLFKEYPTTLLNISKTGTIGTEEKIIEPAETETETLQQDDAEQVIIYSIKEDTHTKTGAKIWVVSPNTELSKHDFTEVRRKLATLQGFYSSFKHGFIFKYDPTEKLKPA